MPTVRQFVYEIQAEDVGKAFHRLPGCQHMMGGGWGSVVVADIGKRIFLVNGEFYMENSQQLQERLAREGFQSAGRSQFDPNFPQRTTSAYQRRLAMRRVSHRPVGRPPQTGIRLEKRNLFGRPAYVEAGTQSAGRGNGNLVDRLRSHLRHEFKQFEPTEMDIEGAIWWFANDYHDGMSSELYQILSTSEYHPAPSYKSVQDEPEEVRMFYDELVRKFEH